MRFVALAAFGLLAACEQQEPAANTATAQANSEASNSAAVRTSATALGASVAADQAKTIMHVRHERMEEIGDAMKLVSRELKGVTPDLAKVRNGAGTIARLAPQVTDWFSPGTGPDVGKTEAKAAIWQKPEDFAAKRDTFQRAAAAFNSAARGNDLAAIKAAHGDLGKSCKACHDLYREEDH